MRKNKNYLMKFIYILIIGIFISCENNPVKIPAYFYKAPQNQRFIDSLTVERLENIFGYAISDFHNLNRIVKFNYSNPGDFADPDEYSYILLRDYQPTKVSKFFEGKVIKDLSFQVEEALTKQTIGGLKFPKIHVTRWTFDNNSSSNYFYNVFYLYNYSSRFCNHHCMVQEILFEKQIYFLEIGPFEKIPLAEEKYNEASICVLNDRFKRLLYTYSQENFIVNLDSLYSN